VTQYILRRLVMVVPVLLVVGIVVFTLVHLTPGDPAAVALGPDATPAEVQRLREQLGLDQPLYIQFFIWFGDVVRLDLGQSIFLDMPVTHALFNRAQPTALLTLYALTVAIVIGVPAGAVAALKENTLVDRFLVMFAISGAALPVFVLGILLILLFPVQLGILSVGGYTPIQQDFWDHLRRMVLPSFALGFASAGLLARLVRSSMLDVMREDYIRTARAKGLAMRLVVMRHALRNALIPAVTVIGYLVGTLLGGAVVTETVFTIPGMGRLVVQSVLRRDYPVIQGAVMLIAAFYVFANLFVDVLYVYIDPRIRYGD
jgi:peptide/nickel transport system permease protein